MNIVCSTHPYNTSQVNLIFFSLQYTSSNPIQVNGKLHFKSHTGKLFLTFLQHLKILFDLFAASYNPLELLIPVHTLYYASLYIGILSFNYVTFYNTLFLVKFLTIGSFILPIFRVSFIRKYFIL